MTCSCVHGNEPTSSIKSEKVCYKLYEDQLLKKAAFSWIKLRRTYFELMTFPHFILMFIDTINHTVVPCTVTLENYQVR